MPERSTGVVKDEESQNEKSGFILSTEMSEAVRYYAQKFEHARVQRDTPHEFFDDMSYAVDYVKNRKAVNSYLKKKKNDSEVRVVTGTTEKKIETVVNELVAMNLTPALNAFDEDDVLLEELSEDITDVLLRTEEREHADEIYYEAYLELVTQRAVFMEETYEERLVSSGSRRTGGKGKKSTRSIYYPRKKIVSGLKMYLGDISIPAYLFHMQPFIFKVDIISYEEARSLYGTKKNFKFVRPGSATGSWSSDATQFRVSQVSETEVEVFTYYSALDNEWNVFVNMIPMEELGTPLPYDHDGYCIEMVVPKPVWTDWAYGRSLAASAKVLQSLGDESFRMLIRKFRQAIEPPSGVRGSKVYSRDIFVEGTMTNGVMKDDFSKLVDHNGVTQSEMEMMNFIERKAEEFVGRSDISQGLGTDKRMTATQVLETQKQAAKQLGLIVFAALKLKRYMSFQRVFTIVDKLTKPVGTRKSPYGDDIENIYMNFSRSETDIGDGVTGEKMVQFSDKDLTRDEQYALLQEENKQMQRGRNWRKKVINVDTLRNIPLTWYISVEPKERKGSMLQQVTFQDQLMQAVSIEKLSGGQKRINWTGMAGDFERIWQRKDTFLKDAPQQGQMQQGQMQDQQGQQDMSGTTPDMQKMLGEIDSMQGSQVGSQAASGAKQGASRPSVNTLLQQ